MLLIGVVGYYETLTSFFLSDDFKFISTITQGKDTVFFTQGGLIFRPISIVIVQAIDALFGLQPAAYHIYHLLVHCLTGFFIYRACLLAFKGSLGLTIEQRGNWALLAGFGFILYPFASETVVWIACRGTITAGMCTAIAYYFYWKSAEKKIFYFPSLLFFFIALMSYESPWAFPLIIAFHEGMRWYFNRSYRLLDSIRTSSLYFGIFFLYFLIRSANMISVEGNVGKYTLLSPVDSILNIGRFLSRLVVLPQVSTLSMIIIAGLILFLVGMFYLLAFFKKPSAREGLLVLAGSTLISILPVMHLGIDTHDSEGGRYLYFPAIFFLMVISLLLVLLISRKQWLFLCTGLLGGCFLLILKYTNQDWRNAGQISEQTVSLLKQAKGCSAIYIWNLPEQLRGAYIFRQPLSYTQSMYFPELPEVNVLSKYQINHPKERLPIKKVNETTWMDSKNNVSIVKNNNGTLLIQNKTDHMVRFYKDTVPQSSTCIYYFSEGLLKKWKNN